MAFAVSTVGQGGSVSLTMPACSINAGTNTDVSGLEIDIKPISGNAAGFVNILGIGTNNTTALRIEVATGVLQWRYSGTVYLSSAAGMAPLGERAKYGAEYEESTTSLFLTKNGVRIAGPYIAAANSLTTNIAWTQLGKVGTSSPSPTTMELYGVRTFGGNATYAAIWDDTGASGDGANWTDDTATRSITLVGYTGATNSWWLFYNNSAGRDVTGTFAASAIAGAAVSGVKVALQTFDAKAYALEAANAQKIAIGTLQAAANVYFGITSYKTGRASFNARAVATADVQGGNIVVVIGTFSASAVGKGSAKGRKASTATFVATATTDGSGQGRKHAAGSLRAKTVANGQVVGYKIGRATFSATAQAMGTMHGYNASALTPVTEWTLYTSSQPATLFTWSDPETFIYTNS